METSATLPHFIEQVRRKGRGRITKQFAEADNAIESPFEVVFVFERFGPSLVTLRQPHCGLAQPLAANSFGCSEPLELDNQPS